MEKIIVLKQNQEFKRLYARGKTAVGRRVVVYYKRSASPHNRLGITVSKKIGKAVVRNRIRRIIREAYRLEADVLLPGYDMVIVARARGKRKMPGYSQRTLYFVGAGRTCAIVKKLCLWLLQLYRRHISPAIPARCRYHPSCSAYAVRCLEEYTLLRAVPLIVWRLLRCNPFTHGGVDPVPADLQERNDTAEK